jgi:hypothetical protein
VLVIDGDVQGISFNIQFNEHFGPRGPFRRSLVIFRPKLSRNNNRDPLPRPATGPYFPQAFYSPISAACRLFPMPRVISERGMVSRFDWAVVQIKLDCQLRRCVRGAAKRRV